MVRSGGLYFHIPFCRNKCIYCDFYTAGSRIAVWKEYVNALKSEFLLRKPEVSFEPVSIYLGGGTPSLIPDDLFTELTDFIKKEIDFQKVREFTIEVNPEDLSEEKCKIWKEAGVNRVSIGIQSLNDKELKLIGRGHDARKALQALEILKLYFDNISVDLMFGLPGQTLESYSESIEQIIRFKPSHLSSYSLMTEEGTALTLLVSRKKIILPDEEKWLEMFYLTRLRLSEAGILRYETSNYAKPGFESLHNTNYWLGKPYIGLGPAAHSFDGFKIRRANPNDLKGYLRFYASSELRSKEFFYDKEILTPVELKEEMIMTRLRMVKGLDISEFEKHFGEEEKEILIKKSRPWLDREMLHLEAGFLSFSEKGFLLSDTILSSLF